MYLKHKRMLIFVFLISLTVSGISQEVFGKEGGSETDVAGRVIESSLGMKFAYIPPGSFMMGSPAKEEGRGKDEDKQHKVTLTKGFYMQTTEVTVGQWRAFIQETGFKTDAETKGGAKTMENNEWHLREGHYWDNPGFSQSEDHPVTCVSWKDVQAFIEWLKGKDGKTYRLPTEAEWEYASRAGTETRFYWGKKADCSKANFGHSWTDECKGKKEIKTVKTGSYSPNPWGLYDTVGNVWEWCQDWYGEYPDAYVTDPEGAPSGEKRVVRGGSWWSYSRYCRSAARAWCVPDDRWFNLGFRLVMIP